MKKHYMSIVLLTLGFSAANAATVVEDALMNVTNYELAGTFGQHDFAPLNDNDPFDWAYTTANGNVYQLKGEALTESNPFGWLKVDVAVPTPAWYMFQLNDDVDGDGTTRYDWVLLKTDMQNKAVYKLEGVTDEGNFKYSDKLNIDYTINGNTIQTGALGSFDTSVPYDCTNTTSVLGKTYTVKSGSDGAIKYDCETQEYSLVGVSSLTITNVSSTKKVTFSTTDGTLITANIVEDAQQGTIHKSGEHSTYGSFDCRETHSVTLPLMVSNNADNLEDAIESLMDDDNIITTTCPDWMYEEEDYDDDFTMMLRVELIQNFIITDSTNTVHTVSQYFNVQ